MLLQNVLSVTRYAFCRKEFLIHEAAQGKGDFPSDISIE
jgi:hypothetical protein